VSLVSLGDEVSAGRFRSRARGFGALALGLLLVVAAGLIVLERRLSGPAGMSVYVLQRSLRNVIRDATVPEPPSLADFSNAGPNVVILILDCYRLDYLPVAPNLAGLAEQSWSYARYYSAAPWTKPSTVSLFTGLHVRKHFVLKGGGSRLPADALTLAELMQARGFRTGGFVWNPHLTRRQSFDQGFDHYVDHARRGSKSLLYEFVSWLDAERPDRFFAYVHFQGTHDPYYDDNDLRTVLGAPPYEGDLDFTNMDYKFAVKGGRALTQPEAAHLEHLARGKATRIDRQAVGEFLERFYRSGLADNTLLIVTSDHGDAFFEHGAVSHGSTIYNEEIHVPLVMRFPARFAQERGFPERGQDPCPASTVDLLPTVMDFIGAPAPREIDGVSLVPTGRAERCGRSVISERTVETGSIVGAALISGDRKLIVDYTEDGRKLELYDPVADPGETRDVAGLLAEDAAALDSTLAEALNEDGSSMARWSEADGVIPQDQLDALRELGYAE
jgi:arylsulfatase A-like enzyme